MDILGTLMLVTYNNHVIVHQWEISDIYPVRMATYIEAATYNICYAGITYEDTRAAVIKA